MKGTKLLMAAGLLVGLAHSAYAGSSDCCPRCSNKTCVPVTVDKEIKKHCYEVECKEICIPKTRFPWQKCCKPTCGRVINVRVFKKVEYKCKSCGYKWEIQGGKGCHAQGGKVSRNAAPSPSPAIRHPYRVVSLAPTAKKTPPTVRRTSFFDYFKK